MSSAVKFEREVVLTHFYAAPRELVFSAWTEARHLKNWWGPKMFSNPVCEVDPRVGGIMRIVMQGPDGSQYPMTATFTEMAPPERLAFTAQAENAEGGNHLETVTEVSFEEEGTGTKLTLRTRGYGFTAASEFMLQGMEAGWSQSLVKLEELAATFFAAVN